MTVKDLKEQINYLDDDLKVFIRAHSNPCGNITEAKEAKEDTYGLFGTSIDCVILEPDL